MLSSAISWNFLTQPTFVLTIVVALLAFVIFRKRYSNLPPGPWGLPFFGYGPFLGSQPHLTLSRLAEKYGNVMSLTFSGKTVIHLSGFETIREAFLTMGDKFAGRPQDFTFFIWLTDSKGIAQSEGPEWKEHRRFVLRTLRDFGFGKLSLAGRIQLIAEDIIKELKDTHCKPYNLSHLFSNSSCNVMCSLLFDRHFPLDDPEFKFLHGNFRRALELLPDFDAFLTMPFARHFLKLTNRYRELCKIKANFFALMEKYIRQHEDTFDSSHLRDYMDVFLEERRKAIENGEETTFSLHRLACIAINLMLAGTETTSLTLQWSFRLLMAYPDVQDRIHKELDEVFGRDRLPSWTDRSNLPYTEAFVNEVLRYSTLVPIAPFHSTLEETTFQGYTIPKRSSVMPNMWSVHYDPKYWPDPDRFDPTRFLEPNGKFTTRDHLIPFSIGKRFCIGESLARMEFFLFLTNILQNFYIRPPEGEEASKDIKFTFNLFRVPLPFNFCFIPR